jgi:hypothetical protein
VSKLKSFRDSPSKLSICMDKSLMDSYSEPLTTTKSTNNANNLAEISSSQPNTNSNKTPGR